MPNNAMRSQPHRRVGDFSLPRKEFRDRPGEQLADGEQHQPDRDREPRGLHALGDGVRPAAGAVQAGGAGGGAVGQEGQLGGDLGEHDRADGQRTERHRAEMPDDGRVDQQVERLGGQHAERGHGEAEHLLQRHGHGTRSR